MKNRRIVIFARDDHSEGMAWKTKLARYIATRHHGVSVVDDKPDVVIALGGDGTILEAARKYRRENPLIVGFNLGHVGFLASVRRPKDFFTSVDRLVHNKFHISGHMMGYAKVSRKGKKVWEAEFLNEIAVISPLGSTKLSVSVEDHPLQYIHGTGVLVATPTGSTAYNLSAHGPIVAPDISCFIVTEVLDHHIPTPSVVIKRTKTISITVDELRNHGLLSIRDSKDPADLVITADGGRIFSMHEHDVVSIRRSSKKVRFVEFEQNYFWSSLQEKFAFR